MKKRLKTGQVEQAPQYDEEPLPGNEDMGDDTIRKRRPWYYFGFGSKKPYMIAYFIYPGQRIAAKPVWLTTNKGYFKYRKGCYSILREAIFTQRIKRRLRPVSYYFFGFPEPIMFRKTETGQQTTAETLKNLLNTKVINDLAKGNASMMEFIIIIALILMALLQVLILIKVWGGGGK